MSAANGDAAIGSEPFSAIAQTYEGWFSTSLGAFVDGQQLRALDRLLVEPERGRVIEVGAGTGHVARHLVRRGYQVTAVEPSPAMLAAGQPLSDGFDISWSAASAERLPFPDGAFDGALFFTTIEFVREPERALREAFRTVRGGGWLAVGYLNALSPWAALYRHQADLGRQPWTAARFFTQVDLEQLAGQAASLTEAATYFGPAARPPYDEADEAGLRAGNEAALGLCLWRKNS